MSSIPFKFLIEIIIGIELFRLALLAVRAGC